MKTKTYLGVSFYDHGLQIAEVGFGKKTSVLSLAEMESVLDFSEESAELNATHAKVSTVVQEISYLLKETSSTADHLSFALPADPLFIMTLPVDPTLKGDEFTAHLEWELHQFFPDAGPKDFVTDSYVLPSKRKDARKTFLVSVRRGVVAFLQKVASQLSKKLCYVDIDHFSTEKSLVANYPEFKKQTVVLMGLRQNGIDASLVKNHEMVDYRSYPRSNSQTIASRMTEYVQAMKDLEATGNITTILLHGTQVTPETLSTLKTEVGLDVAPLDAFRHLVAADTIDQSLVAAGHRFAAAIGVALRGS